MKETENRECTSAGGFERLPVTLFARSVEPALRLDRTEGGNGRIGKRLRLVFAGAVCESFPTCLISVPRNNEECSSCEARNAGSEKARDQRV